VGDAEQRTPAAFIPPILAKDARMEGAPWPSRSLRISDALHLQVSELAATGGVEVESHVTCRGSRSNGEEETMKNLCSGLVGYAEWRLDLSYCRGERPTPWMFWRTSLRWRGRTTTRSLERLLHLTGIGHCGGRATRVSYREVKCKYQKVNCRSALRAMPFQPSLFRRNTRCVVTRESVAGRSIFERFRLEQQAARRWH
jgi:hypothetical protein